MTMNFQGRGGTVVLKTGSCIAEGTCGEAALLAIGSLGAAVEVSGVVVDRVSDTGATVVVRPQPMEVVSRNDAQPTELAVTMAQVGIRRKGAVTVMARTRS